MTYFIVMATSGDAGSQNKYEYDPKSRYGKASCSLLRGQDLELFHK
jgi:hypothetical protein